MIYNQARTERIAQVRAAKKAKRKKAAILDQQKRNEKRKKKTVRIKKQPESNKDRKKRVKSSAARFYDRMRAKFFMKVRAENEKDKD